MTLVELAARREVCRRAAAVLRQTSARDLDAYRPDGEAIRAEWVRLIQEMERRGKGLREVRQ